LSSRRTLTQLRWWSLATCLVLGTLARPARAQESHTNWRRSEPPPQSPQRFALELRFGPYHPQVDEDFGGPPGPYDQVFGSDSRFFFGVEFDWQLLRIPGVGTLGPGIGWGYTRMSAQAALQSNGEPSAEKTFLSIMPMYGIGVFRVDVLARETPIPIVGYVKAGLGYGIYWTGNDLETQARGHTWGTHFALGGMLLLDAIDEHASIEIDNQWGINNSYFFFEWMRSDLNGFGSTDDHSVMHIGTHTWVIGLAFEM